MIASLVTAPAALPLDWDDEVKGHLRVDSDDEKRRVEGVLIPAAADWIEGLTARQLITATWAVWFPCFEEALEAARRHPGTYPEDVILLPKPPLQSVTWVKYYDSDNVLQTWAASNYVVTVPAGPKAGPGWIRLADDADWPSTYSRPDAIEVKCVAGYGSTSASVPGGIKQAMLILMGEMFERREVSITGTIIQQVPLGALHLGQGYMVEV